MSCLGAGLAPGTGLRRRSDTQRRIGSEHVHHALDSRWVVLDRSSDDAPPQVPAHRMRGETGRGGPVVGHRLSAHDFLAAPYSSILQRFPAVPLYDGGGVRQLAAQDDGGQLRREGAALAGAFEGGDDPAGGEVYQGAQLVSVWPVGGPPEDAE